MAEEEGRLKEGCKVKLVGLKNKPENNGREGVVKCYVEDKQRYEIEFPCGGTSKLQRANLEIIIPVAPVAKTDKTEKRPAKDDDARSRSRKKAKPELSEKQPTKDHDARSRSRKRSRSRRRNVADDADKNVALDASHANVEVGQGRGRGRGFGCGPASCGTGRGRGCGVGSLPRGVLISKAMAKVLRHTALSAGILMRSDGFCDLDELLGLADFRNLQATREEIEELVLINDKQRFQMTREGDKVWVRATQGHSIKSVSDESLLQPLAVEDVDLPEVCVHGTYRKHLEAIKQQGLLAGGGVSGRNHVHFAPFEPGDGRVISGMRYNCEVAVYLNLREALLAGVPFFKSANQVILTPGIKGVVPKEFIQGVKDLQAGQWL